MLPAWIRGWNQSLRRRAKQIGSDFFAGMGDSLDRLGMCQLLNDSTLLSQLLSRRPPRGERGLPRGSALPSGRCGTCA